MKTPFKILILIVCAYSYVRAMEEDNQEPREFLFNTVCKTRCDLEDNNEDNQLDTLNKELNTIIKSTAIELNELASNNINLMHLLPSLTVTYRATLQENTALIKWDTNFKLYYLPDQLSQEEGAQLKKFTARLNEIKLKTQAQLESIILPYISHFSLESFIKLKIQLHFNELKEEPEDSSWTDILKYCSTLFNVYRW